MELVRDTFNLWEHAFYSHSEGVLSDELRAIWHESYCEVLPLPWFQALDDSGARGFLPGFTKRHTDCCNALEKAQQTTSSP
jgi:hypothetical protein